MILTRTDKITIVFFVAAIGLCVLLLIGKVGAEGMRNQHIIRKIAVIRALTDKTALEKHFDYGDERANANKLNINKVDIATLSGVPGMRKSLAKKIVKYVSEHNGVKSLRELLEIKTLTHKKLRRLCNYITVRGGHAGNSAWGTKLNLNFANENELKKIKGLSARMAKKIVEFRDANGGFFSIEDLKEIPGMTSTKFDRISDKIEVR